MGEKNYLQILVEDIHSAVVATLGEDGRPQTRVIDMMLWDEGGLYFLTARGKEFYRQLMEQGFIALSAVKGKQSISLRGRVEKIGGEKLDEIFERNPYMKGIYPGDTRQALEVFRLYEARGEYFDISDPSHVERGSIAIGDGAADGGGYFVGPACDGCGVCASVCPQSCIDISRKPAVIDPNHCLHCGRCAESCPRQAVVYSRNLPCTCLCG